MHRKYLAIVELREKALGAREKARRARRLARLDEGNSGESFKRVATELDAKARQLEGQMEDLRSQLAAACQSGPDISAASLPVRRSRRPIND